MRKWFCFDWHSFSTYATEEEAKAAAEAAIEDFRQMASERWDEGVEQVCWGKIHCAADKEVLDRRSSDGEEMWDYKLVPVD